ncbi:MAG: hypothetical protein A2070_05975 [Bdellovibrionales bacterium GWC1_52_8]|nr:MAG: hypothetical protein A2Z97_08220 [Bdellovibrionales bacterium GWB1_52_6]OFZ03834.1 MAG: hypothetical protein A2X97_15660 [Bdellovibrionales bacterium GWA1_52_35]OFZ39626.1 MAG: hypothetical protein A2070_05975 [Bdellovibrionales bacterium GWC1_52_8]
MENQKKRILLVDDDEQLRDILTIQLESHGFAIDAAADSTQAFEVARRENVAAIFLDLRLGPECGLNLVPRLRELCPNAPILMITAHGDLDSALEGFKLGIAGYLKKPFKKGQLISELNKVLQASTVFTPRKSGVRSSMGKIVEKVPSVDPIFAEVYERIAVAAEVNSPVVIHGESGTGKELAARALHECGSRKSGPFVAFNCGAIPDSLAETELFGYVRGAFTDARDNKQGLFVRADRGTLFLDEIAEASPSLQTKLLRVLQEREVTPVGGTQPIRIDVRIISASHQPLLKCVEEGRFRQDLFFRIHVLTITIPPLRLRRFDIRHLGRIFAHKIAKTNGTHFEGFTQGAEEQLLAYPWPGNIRELQNRIEQAMVISGGGILNAQSLFPEIPEGLQEPEISKTLINLDEQSSLQKVLPSFFEAKSNFERSYLEQVLAAAKGNIARAARLASKSRTEVYSLIRKHGLNPDSYE